MGEKFGKKLGCGFLLLLIFVLLIVKISPAAGSDDQALSGLDDLSQPEAADVISAVQFNFAPVSILSGQQSLNIIWRGSPNKDVDRKEIKYIVLHWFGSGTLDSVDRRFRDSGSRVSAHYGVSGNTIYQWVAENEVAYHCGDYLKNQQSIGIEHDATIYHRASEETYRTSIALVRMLCKKYGIPIDRAHILKHSEVRATDCPGTLDVDRIVNEARGYSP